ncbi:energy-coupling factor transporter ATPase [Streptococcus sp. DD12]|uniref:energy-coupling factor transporter ATPase n=1 Tax=Streptococcus sp. DD12 TaxID=1777880 RepID=UPI0007968655|nr:energy-coupling factor transporter ATPase [Streptococcus sp. DD12]KXT76099.1 ATPase component of general energizing module of ECF transporter [Streptococcus sp. DD12]
MITFKDVSFSYDKDKNDKTLDRLSFHVKPGEWLSIVGHNGSGKSTTVRLMDGLLEAESGDIIIDGDRLTIDNVWQIRQKIGMVFQNPDNQFVGATVEDDIAFGLENQGISHEEMVEKIQQALEQVHMTDFRNREPARLSGGQKQRVAVAGALILEPKILVLDEATSMLDPAARAEIIGLIQEIRQKRELTVISVTHDLDEVALSDRVLVLKKGHLVMETTPKQLFSQPHDLDGFGLDQPFTMQVVASLRETMPDWPSHYLTAKELEDLLWEYRSTM